MSFSRILLLSHHNELDCLQNDPRVTGPPNAHSNRTITRLSNGVHPASSGYDQIGDSVYSWLVAQLQDQAGE